jgi:hypothetical protein
VLYGLREYVFVVVFGWYRIGFGVVVLVTAYIGWVVWQP